MSQSSSLINRPGAPTVGNLTLERRRRWLSALGVSAFAGTALGGCGGLPVTTSAQVVPGQPGQPVTAAPEPRVRNRDRWRYAVTNLYNRESIGELTAEVVEIAPVIRVKLTHSTGQSLPDEIYSRPWKVAQETHYDVPIVFAQPLPILPARLEPGAFERIRTTYHPLTLERPLNWQLYVDARGWERIRVPAGQFDCLRVERRIWFTHFDVFRYSSERYETLWYAPTVNRWVQREWSGTFFTPGGRRGGRQREDWVRWQLLDHIPAPISS